MSHTTKSIINKVIENENISLEMTPGEALIAVGDLMHAALQLLGQFVTYAKSQSEDEGETA